MKKVLFLSFTLILINYTINAQSWSYLGNNAGFSAGEATHQTLVFDTNNTPYVAFIDFQNGEKATVMKFNGSSWVNVGSPGFSGKSNGLSFAIDNNNTLYVAYIGSSSYINIMKFNGSSWVNVGETNSQFTGGFYIDLAFDNNNTPYVVYQDKYKIGYTFYSQTSVIKFDGTSWGFVGSRGFSPEASYKHHLVFDSNNRPYVAFTQSNYYLKIMKFNGTNWTSLPTAFSGYNANFDITVDSNNIPYVAFSTTNDGSRATVKKFENGNWVTIGQTGFSTKVQYNTISNSISLALDAQNMPYIAYRDQDNNYKTTVMKFDGSSWITLGNKGFTKYNSFFQSLALDNNDTPYVAYKSYTNNNKTTVMKLNFSPKISTTTANTITNNSVVIGGYITTDYSHNVTERGVVYSAIDSTPIIGEDNVVKKTNGNNSIGSFTENINNLAVNTKYYYSAYAINSEGTTYGEVKNFTTLKAPPKLVSITRKTPSSENTTATAVTFTATFSKDLSEISKDDFVLTSNSGGSISNIVEVNEHTYDIVIININSTAGSLQLGIKGVGSSSGVNTIKGIQGLSLASDAPETNESYTILTTQITTNNASDITANSAILGGNIQNNGVVIAERGVLYATNNNNLIISGTNTSKANISSGTGDFSTSITNLTANTFYYFRTYAITDANTKAYGAIKSFSTLSKIELNNHVTNTGLSLSGSDDFVSLNNISSVSSSPISIAMWINPSDYNGALIGEFYSGNSNTRNFLSINNDGKLTFDHYNPSGGVFTSNGVIPKNKWTHIVLTQENGSRKFYINGVLDTEDSSTEEYTGSTPDQFYLGYRGGGSSGNNYNGQLDEVTLWSKVLTTDEITNMYNTDYIDIADSNLQQYLNFDHLTDATQVQAEIGTNGRIENPAPSFTTDFTGVKKQTKTLFTSGQINEVVTDALVQVNVSGTPTFTLNKTDGLPITINTDGKIQLTANLTNQFIGTHNIVFTATLNSTDYKFNTKIIVVNDIPILTTLDATNITSSSVKIGGQISSKGLSDITERGVVYSSSNTTPKIGETNVFTNTNGSGLGSYAKVIGGFENNTTYYYRAYATNSQGTAYGNVKTFTTLTPALTLHANTTNKALSLNGNNDYISLNNISNVSSSPISIAMWINPSEYNGALIGEFYSGNSNTRNFLSINNDGKLTFDHYSPSGGTFTSNGVIPKNSWSHIVFTQENGSRKFYINGVLDTENSNTEEYTGTTPDQFYLGYRGGGSSGNNYNGQLDEVTLWSKVLTSSEVTNMYNTDFIDKADSNLQQYLNFDNLTNANNVKAAVGANGRIENPSMSFTTNFTGVKKQTHSVLISAQKNDIISEVLVNTTNTPTFTLNNSDGLPIKINTDGKIQLTDNFTSQHLGVHIISFTATESGQDYKFNSTIIVSSNFPSITTGKATDITATTATLAGEIINEGASSIIEKGVLYSTTNPSPRISDASGTTKIVDSDSGTTFSEVVTGLTTSNIYYYRAYAINSYGVAYGAVKRFTSNNALNFGGGYSSNGDRVIIPDNVAFDFSNGFTIEAWIQLADDGVGGRLGLFTKDDSFSIIFKNLYYSIYTSSNTSAVLIAGNLELNKWTHIAFTYNGTTMRAFINGESAGSETINGTINNSSSPIVLGTFSNAFNFKGAMDELRIWGRALSEAEIKNGMNKIIPNNADGLIAYYQFNQGTAEGDNTGITTLIDSSPNNLHGSINNFSLTGNTSNFVAGVNTNNTDFTDYVANRFNTTGNWSNKNNWSLGIVPTKAEKATISNGKTVTIDVDDLKINDFELETGATLSIPKDKELIIGSAFISNGNLTLSSDKSNSGVLFIKGTSTGTVTYKRGGLLANKWSIITPPVSGQKIKAFAEDANNNIRTSGNKYAIAYYDDSKPSGQKWVYYFADMDENLEFEVGKSYAISRATDGEVSFTGTLITDTTIKTGVDNQWNAIGNPFTTYYPANKNSNTSFLNDNTNVLDDTYKGIYVWDNTQNKYIAITEVDATNRSLPPGQGFFVRLKTGQTQITFNEEKRETQPSSGTSIFAKSANQNPSITLLIDNGKHQVSTNVKYFDNATLGFDPGYDIGNFNGAELDVFTRLVNPENTTNFTIQSVPKEHYANTIIPVGITAKAGETITFSATAKNLPDNLQLYLEDKANNSFTQLDKTSANYKITLSKNTNNTGRFYLHTTAGKPLAVDEVTNKSLQVFISQNRILKITGNQNKPFNIELIDLLGRTVFTAKNSNEVQIPKQLKTGVYIVKVQNEQNQLIKKILIE